MDKVKVDKQPVEISLITDSERKMLDESGNDPQDFVAVECCALGIQAIPQQASVKSEDGTKIKCVPFQLQVLVPIDAQKAFQTSLYVSEQMQANTTIQKAMPTPPIVRVLLKREYVSDTFIKEENNIFEELLSNAYQKPSEK